MIRRGHMGHAYLLITLQNVSDESGYKYSIYGKEITIERKIHNTGKSTYKLYSYDEMKKDREKRKTIKLPYNITPLDEINASRIILILMFVTLCVYWIN